MQLGIFSKAYKACDFETVCRHMKAQGFSWTQLNLGSAGIDSYPEYVPDEKIGEIADAACRHGIRFAALSGTFNMIDPDESARVRACVQFAEQCRVARELKIPTITLCTGSRHPRSKWLWHEENLSPKAWSALMRSTEAVLKCAEENRVRLGIEPEKNNIICSAEKAREYLHTVDSDWLGIVMDGANLVYREPPERMKEILLEAFELLGPKIILAHAKDISRNEEESFVAAGDGRLDYEAYIRLLKLHRYEGPLILHGLGEEQAPRSARFLRDFL